MNGYLRGERFEISGGDPRFPEALRHIPKPPKRLFGVGSVHALVPGLAVIGARKATPYGIGCAERFAGIAAQKGIAIISGGARGCDSAAHRAALAAGAPTVVFLGGGCDCIYPPENAGLFQQVVDAGGAVVSENPWDFAPKPYTFRERNRLIAGLACAVLIVEAGLPSGTFSTADEALAAGREVLVVPGSIASASSRGSNRLLAQGAVPIVDDETFEDALYSIFDLRGHAGPSALAGGADYGPLIEAIRANPMGTDEVYQLAVREYGVSDARTRMMETLAEGESERLIARQPDGRWGALPT